MAKGSLSPFYRYLFSLLLVVLSTAIEAADTVIEQAERYLSSEIADSLQTADRVAFEFSPINPHLRPNRCEQPIQFQSARPIKPGRFSLKASCSAPRTWSIRINGSLEIYRAVLTAERALPRGATLTDTNTLLLEQPVSALRQGYFTAADAVIDFETQVPLRRHQVISPRHLTPPLLIHKGDEVTIHAGSALLSVRMAGVALQDGRRDQQISVQNRRSGKVIRATVVERGEVRAGH